MGTNHRSRGALPRPLTVPLARLALMITLIGCTAACSAPAPIASFNASTRARVYDDYWNTLEREYPFFDLAGVDPRTHRETYRARVTNASDRIEYLHALAGMFGELRDPHVKILVDESWYRAVGKPIARPALGTMWVDRRLYLVSWPSAMGLTPRVRPGARFGYPEVVSIEGYPADFSNIGTLLLGELGTNATLELEWWDGSRETAVVERTSRVFDPSLTAPLSLRTGAGPVARRRAVESVDLGDVTYLWIRTLSPQDAGASWERLAGAINREIDDAIGDHAMVIDLTRNAGGDSRVLRSVLARFIRTGAVVWLGEGPGGFNFKSVINEQDRDGRQPYHGSLVVLTDRYTGSAAEHLAAVIQREQRGRVVGSRTVGAEAMVRSIRVEEGIDVELGLYRLTDTEGRGLQYVGIDPDVEISVTLEAMETLGATEARRQAREARLRAALEAVDRPDLYDTLINRLGDIGYPDLRGAG